VQAARRPGRQHEACGYRRQPAREHRLADDLDLGRSAGAATEVQTQVAVLMLVPTITQAVRRVDGGTDDEGEGREDGDQLISALAAAQLLQVRLPDAQGSRLPPQGQQLRPPIWLIIMRHRQRNDQQPRSRT